MKITEKQFMRFYTPALIGAFASIFLDIAHVDLLARIIGACGAIIVAIPACLFFIWLNNKFND